MLNENYLVLEITYKDIDNFLAMDSRLPHSGMTLLLVV
jgi:hypothetical protein